MNDRLDISKIFLKEPKNLNQKKKEEKKKKKKKMSLYLSFSVALFVSHCFIADKTLSF